MNSVKQEKQRAESGCICFYCPQPDDLMAVADSLDDNPHLDPNVCRCTYCLAFIERCKDEQAKERLRDMVLSRASSLFIARECEAIARVSAAFDPGGWEL